MDKEYFNLYGMRYFVTGDTRKARDLAPFARARMLGLKDAHAGMDIFSGRVIDERTGAEIKLLSSHGVDTVAIHVPPGGRKRKRYIQNLIPAFEAYNAEKEFIGIVLCRAGDFTGGYEFIPKGMFAEEIDPFEWGAFVYNFDLYRTGTVEKPFIGKDWEYEGVTFTNIQQDKPLLNESIPNKDRRLTEISCKSEEYAYLGSTGSETTCSNSFADGGQIHVWGPEGLLKDSGDPRDKWSYYINYKILNSHRTNSYSELLKYRYNGAIGDGTEFDNAITTFPRVNTTTGVKKYGWYIIRWWPCNSAYFGPGDESWSCPEPCEVDADPGSAPIVESSYGACDYSLPVAGGEDFHLYSWMGSGPGWKNWVSTGHEPNGARLLSSLLLVDDETVKGLVYIATVKVERTQTEVVPSNLLIADDGKLSCGPLESTDTEYVVNSSERFVWLNGEKHVVAQDDAVNIGQSYDYVYQAREAIYGYARYYPEHGIGLLSASIGSMMEYMVVKDGVGVFGTVARFDMNMGESVFPDMTVNDAPIYINGKFRLILEEIEEEIDG